MAWAENNNRDLVIKIGWKTTIFPELCDVMWGKKSKYIEIKHAKVLLSKTDLNTYLTFMKSIVNYGKAY